MRIRPLLAAVIFIVSACSGPAGGAILANAPVARPSPSATPVPTPAPSDPQPLVFPRDDGPHDRMMEWWYYTGHLRDRSSGSTFGFEFVVFRAERGDLPVSWASHLALTDETGHTFSYAQRSVIGPAADVSPRDASGVPTGFGFAVPGGEAAPTLATGASPGAATTQPWTMTGSNGVDALRASLDPAEAAAAGAAGAFGIDLRLRTTKPPALHDGIGFVDFGLAGSSYYYSRTRMDASGTVSAGGRTFDVDGIAWFDHQWGDFISVGGGGWDWFALNLDDGSDITLSLVRAADGTYPLVYGTLVEPDGTTRHLAAADFSVTVNGHWTSPRTGTVYPAGWRVTIPSRGLEVELSPTVADQELDTRATSGVVYWEGSQRVAAREHGRAIGGEAYVELTGYGG